MLKLPHHMTGGLVSLICNSSSNMIHVTAVVIRAKLLYFVSVLEWDTVCCFLDCQETRFDARNTQNPMWNSCHLDQKAHLESQQPSRTIDEPEFGNMFCIKSACKIPKDPFYSLPMCLQWDLVNWHTLFTLNVISGLVIVVYGRNPTMLLQG